MNDSHRTFAGSIPENYQRYLVPLIFEDYAADLAGRLELPDGGAVLETACGTGVVTRHLLAGLGDGARLTATDLNPGMIAQARTVLGEAPALALQEADATDLPFDDGAFDAVVCQFGVMFFPDKAKGYAEAARVLKPGGQYLFNVWDSLAHNRLSQAAHETVGALFPDDPPNFLELPFGYHDLSAILRALQAAGFSGGGLHGPAARQPRPRRPGRGARLLRRLAARQSVGPEGRLESAGGGRGRDRRPQGGIRPRHDRSPHAGDPDFRPQGGLGQGRWRSVWHSSSAGSWSARSIGRAIGAPGGSGRRTRSPASATPRAPASRRLRWTWA